MFDLAVQYYCVFFLSDIRNRFCNNLLQEAVELANVKAQKAEEAVEALRVRGEAEVKRIGYEVTRIELEKIIIIYTIE